ncbi:MAG TPA: hypothetical protein VLT33_35375 [Labilithrix sp.]|nr:hypothetical protein [Labilithrix sp.]
MKTKAMLKIERLSRRCSALLLGGALAALASACSDPATSRDPATSPDAAAGVTPSPTGSSTSDSAPTCAGFAGTCAAAATCAPGTARVSGGSDVLCGSSTKSCCVPPAASPVALQKDWGLACTQDGKWTGLPDGSCGGAACAVGCECGLAGGQATCDCSRGLPPSPKTGEVCGLFSCGTISCSVGCHCADAAHGACVCP